MRASLRRICRAMLLGLGAAIVCAAAGAADGDPSILMSSTARHPHTRTALAQAFADWVVSAEGQAAIAAYRINGEQLFFPNAQ